MVPCTTIAVHNHCYVLTAARRRNCARTTTHRGPLGDRTDVIDEGVGRVVNKSTRPTPPTAIDTVERRGARR